MSRTLEVEAAMAWNNGEETKEQVVLLRDYAEHSIIGNVVSILHAEAERLESCLAHMTAWHESARARAEAAEAQNAQLRAALIELKRNTVEVILPNAKTVTLDLGQVALWDACVKQVEEALNAKEATS